MVYRPLYQVLDPRRTGSLRATPPGAELVSKIPVPESRKPDRTLLQSGYMSDCTVICGDVEWATHKAILCSRNNWFRVALGGPFKEASTGVVTIEDTDPDIVKIILEDIYTGGTEHICHTPSKIVEVWKAADFFGMRELADRAAEAMDRRLEASARFLRRIPDPRSPAPPRAVSDRGCGTIRAVYEVCGHVLREPRACPVAGARPDTVFHLCDPEHTVIRRGRACDPSCRQVRNWGGPSLSRPGGTSRPPAPNRPAPDSETRALIEDEIRALCRALALATAETPKGSHVQRALVRHMCDTRVVAWGGYAVCRFLET